MKVYFENSCGNIRLLSDVNNKEGAMNVIRNFLDDHNFKSYYQRYWTVPVDGVLMTCVDVGSHTEFFYIEPPIN